jgi:hypothetical protein
MLGSDPLFDTLVDLSQRRRHGVELVSRRLWLRLWPLALASSPLALLLSLGCSEEYHKERRSGLSFAIQLFGR